MDPLERAIAALQAGLTAEAESICLTITAADPAAFEAWHVLAFAQDAQGKSEVALASYGRALVLRPGHAETLFNRANVLHRLGRLAAALADFDLALISQPDMAPAWYNRGNTLRALDRGAEAIESYDRAIGLKPAYAEAHFNRAVALAAADRHDEALAGFDATVKLRPDFAQALGRRGAALLVLDRAGEALGSLERALSLQPGDAETWNAYGRALRAVGRWDEALAAYDRALAISPTHAHALTNRGNVLHVRARYEEALASFEAALAAAPDHPLAFGGAADCVTRLCDWPRRARYAAGMTARIADESSIIAPLTALAYPTDPDAQQRCARKFTANQIARPPAPLWTGQHRPHARLRIAYLSGDFRDHPVGRLMASILEAHDRDHFEIIGISFGPEEDGELAGRIAAACDAFHDVRALSDGETAQLLFDLEVDIAVDLVGHTGLARPGVLARRPAPLQAAWLGFPGTMGAPFIDHISADETVIPLAERPFYDEAVVRLPGCYLAGDRAQPAPAETPSRAETGLPETGFVFACFNTAWKLSPEVFDVWMRLLAKTPGSVLWLHRDSSRAEENLRREAAGRGIDPQRLIFKDRIAFDRHLALHGLADLFLDTLPYNAHATALDALWAGLPVLTCQGNTFAGRVGASLLQAVGLPELITPDLAAYEALALKLAGDPGELAAIRARLAENQQTSALFDAGGFAQALEAAYEAMWRG